MVELIREVLSWDIRSVSQRRRQTHPPHVDQKTNSKPLLLEAATAVIEEDAHHNVDDDDDEEDGDSTIYHLVLVGLDVSYKIDHHGHVFVDKVTPYEPSAGAAQ